MNYKCPECGRPTVFGGTCTACILKRRQQLKETDKFGVYTLEEIILAIEELERMGG